MKTVTIRIEIATLAKLQAIKARLLNDTKQSFSYDKVINHLIKKEKQK